IRLGVATPERANLLKEFAAKIRVWVIVTSGKEKTVVKEWLGQHSVSYNTEVFSLDDVDSELGSLEETLQKGEI
ncbi:MAG: hypothetical protein MUO27_07960, partial [Sedimentisphaerales bacterium]|nr:hypothetical protein [Sedimentisphaerales bacterium]